MKRQFNAVRIRYVVVQDPFLVDAGKLEAGL
jgi:hypothetical protein